MIRHVLKNGNVVEDIQGHVVKMEDAPSVYALLDVVRKERNGTKNDGENHKEIACG